MNMIGDFSFSHPEFLLLMAILLFIPFFKNDINKKNLEKFADKKLLPFLVQDNHINSNNIFIWSLIYIFTILAISGARYGKKEIDIYQNKSNLVIILDLSNSMNSKDISPSRIIRAKQEIEDILNLKDDSIEISLIGYSDIPHIITPLTYDSETIKNLLQSIDTNLVTISKNNINSAIKMAKDLFLDEKHSKNAILVMSDGNFEQKIDKINDISLSFLGFGTKNGSPFPNKSGNLSRKNGKLQISKLEDMRMKRDIQNGGIYVEAIFLDDDTKKILRILKPTKNNQEKSKITYWNEIFYIPLSIAMLLFLFSFMRVNCTRGSTG